MCRMHKASAVSFVDDRARLLFACLNTLLITPVTQVCTLYALLCTKLWRSFAPNRQIHSTQNKRNHKKHLWLWKQAIRKSSSLRRWTPQKMGGSMGYYICITLLWKCDEAISLRDCGACLCVLKRKIVLPFLWCDMRWRSKGGDGFVRNVEYAQEYIFIYLQNMWTSLKVSLNNKPL